MEQEKSGLFEQVNKRIRDKFKQPGQITFSGEDMSYTVDVLNDIAKEHGLDSYRDYEQKYLEKHPGNLSDEYENEIPDLTEEFANYLKQQLKNRESNH